MRAKSQSRPESALVGEYAQRNIEVVQGKSGGGNYVDELEAR
jgi:hypothetical protein